MRQTRKQLAEDHAYWMVLADLIGWQLYGWTYKNSVTYVVAGQTIQMSAAQRDATVEHLIRERGNA